MLFLRKLGVLPGRPYLNWIEHLTTERHGYDSRIAGATSFATDGFTTMRCLQSALCYLARLKQCAALKLAQTLEKTALRQAGPLRRWMQTQRTKALLIKQYCRSASPNVQDRVIGRDFPERCTALVRRRSCEDSLPVTCKVRSAPDPRAVAGNPDGYGWDPKPGQSSN